MNMDFLTRGDEEEGPTYRIVRFYAPHRKEANEVIRTGLTKEEAVEHCEDPATQEKGQWFDGFQEE